MSGVGRFRQFATSVSKVAGKGSSTSKTGQWCGVAPRHMNDRDAAASVNSAVVLERPHTLQSGAYSRPRRGAETALAVIAERRLRGVSDHCAGTRPATMTEARPITCMSVSPTPQAQPRNPLHGLTLQTLLTALVDRYGWADLAQRIPIRCFSSDPSIASSLKFLRKTPWAREKVEGLYLFMLREDRRAGAPR